MIGALVLIVFLFFINQIFFGFFKKRHSFFSKKLMNVLYLYHVFFYLVYYTYTLSNRSDSQSYFENSQELGDWFAYFGTSTTFINFIAWPFTRGLGFNYEMAMLIFAWFGYLGFVYAYLFFRENIPVKINVFKNLDFLILILFLPNMHFWTASLGKGAPIFMGLMMFSYALKNPKGRWKALLIGSLIIYYIRPHVFLFVAAGTVLGYMTGNEKISLWKKILIYVVMVGSLILVQDTILGVAGLNESEDLIQGFEDFSEDRSGALSTSGSGVDMSSYSLPVKLFTFWFRPLFLDAPGVLGLIVSVENLIYLLLFFKILNKDFLRFLKKSPISVKMSLTTFFLASLAMAFVMSNLGIIMRQKSMVMYFLFFVIYYYLAQQKYDRIVKLKKKRKAKERKELINS